MPDVQIREARLDDRFALARIIIDATLSAFRGRVPDACLNWLSVEESASNWARTIAEHSSRDHLLVAEIDGLDVVALIAAGGASAGVVQDRGISAKYAREISSLQVDPAWQRKGLGRILIQHIAGLMMDERTESLMVRVLKDNPNIAFYEALGAKRIGSQPYVWEGYETSEIIMGWDSLVNLT